MVQTLSIIGAVFTVGGSYVAVDTLRDVLIAKTITMPYATRMAIASAAAFGGLYVMTNLSAQRARKQTKQNLGKQLMAAEVFDAAAYDHRGERAWSNMLSNAPVDIEVKQVDLFHDKHILAHDEAHRAAQSWLRKNEKARFNEIHYMLYQIDAGKWGMEYVALDTMDSEELTFHDWSNQEMMNHGKDDSFEDWVEHEIDSHGNISLQEWGDHEQESHTKRYGSSRSRGAFTARDAEDDYLLDPSDMTCHLCEKDGSKRGGLVTGPTGVAVCEMCLDEVDERDAESKTRGYSLNRFNKRRRPSGDSFRRKGRRSALRSMMAAESDDDDDNRPVPDREPRRGAPDLWFAEGNSKKTFPPIFKKATTGKIQEWRIRTEQLPDGNWTYISSHGQLGGSMVEGKGVVIKAGKQGRTVEEQANAEAAAKWKKKKKKGYFESADEARNNVVVLPMLAHNFKKRAHNIEWPAIGQPKLDGVRCLARLEADGTVSLTSRDNNQFPGLDHIREELATRLRSLGDSKGDPFPHDIIIDGELYADPKELTFQQSVGVVRRNNKTPEDLEDEKKIKLNVYDSINLNDLDMDFIDRYNLASDSLSNMDSVAMVENTSLSDTDAIDPLHDQFVTEGYEGLMIRNVKGPYKLNGKSQHLQKYKSFEDAEFEIVGYDEGKGNYEGTVIWICQMPDGKKFRVKPDGPHAYRSKLFEEADSHIGKMVTVRFFELTDGGVPRQPTGGWIRDYEAESFNADTFEAPKTKPDFKWVDVETAKEHPSETLKKAVKKAQQDGWEKVGVGTRTEKQIWSKMAQSPQWKPWVKDFTTRCKRYNIMLETCMVFGGTAHWKNAGEYHPDHFGEEGEWAVLTKDNKVLLFYYYSDWENNTTVMKKTFTISNAKAAEVFNAFSMSDRPVSVKFGKGTSGNAKMKAVFTDGSGDTKTTQFGYKGMSDFTKHHDEDRKSSYLARHGAKSSGQKWNDPTTAGSLSRWVLWNKKSLSESKKSFKNKFNLRAEETNARYSVADLGYQESMFITDPGRRAVWDYETDYSVEDAE